MKGLRIIVDAHVWGADEAFAAFDGFKVDLQLMEHSDITPERLKEADVLVTRSSTRVDAKLLEHSPVRFVATATIGDDHVDKSWLKRRGIAFANAAGSSTGSVLEYMWAVLLELHAMKTIQLPHITLGVVGAGRIGEQLASTAHRLGIRVMRCDPPRAQTEGPSGFHALDDLLDQADVISLHTPLTHGGPYPTFHLI
ncbi:MAG: erythronate-4-phosphate dehydrogenase, partial [Zetaproteobacteria bacterium]